MRLMLLTLATFFLICGVSLADDSSLPMSKRISAEKLQLAQRYQEAIKKCHNHHSRRARHSCDKAAGDNYNDDVAKLESDPQGYFAAKEQEKENEKMLKDPKAALLKQ